MLYISYFCTSSSILRVICVNIEMEDQEETNDPTVPILIIELGPMIYAKQKPL